MTRSLRVVVIVVFGGLIAIGFVLDAQERDFGRPDPPVLVSVPVSSDGTWFCPGGSDVEGPAAVGLEIVNAGSEAARAQVSAFRSDVDDVPNPLTLVVEAGSRAAISLPELAPDADWVGAVVEVFDPDVVVEQTYDGATGTDRAPCFTRTAESFVVTDGATRDLSHGERMVLLLLNPFHEDAVADIDFDADVGPDSLTAVVVPGRRVVAIDVTSEVTVASRVSARIAVVSGRLSVARLQLRDSEEVRGLAVTPAVPDGAIVSVLPTVSRRENHFDVVTVTNPSTTETADVDLEIVTDGSVALDPIELTVRPGRTVRVDLSTEARLGGLEEFGLVVRSLTGVPVAAMVESTVGIGSGDVVGVAASPALDAAGLRWVVPMEGESSSVAVVNPSLTEIAMIEIGVVDEDGHRAITTVELGPGRRTSFPASQLGTDRPIVVVDSTAPVVVGRVIVGFTSRQISAAVISDAAVPLVSVE